MSLRGKIELFGHEDICASKYLDSEGVWTIGVGLTSSEIPDIAAWPMERKLTLEEVVSYFENGIGKYEDAINKNLSVVIPQEQFDALVSWCYNVGVGWVAKSTVMRLINLGNASKAQLYNALMMYNKPKAIIGRRTKEAKLLSGEGYQNGGKIEVFSVSSKGTPIYSKSVDVSEQVTKILSASYGTTEVTQTVTNSAISDQPNKSSVVMEVLKFIFRWVKY